jgi:hypothetical protein
MVKNKNVNRIIKYSALLLVLVLVAYKSLYFEKLSERNKQDQKFDPIAYSKQRWEKDFPVRMDSAVSLPVLMDVLNKEPQKGFDLYTRSLAIGNYRYALVSMQVQVGHVSEDAIQVILINEDSLVSMELATEFIYGNAIRDASGLVEVSDFPNTADLNGISEALNQLVKDKVVKDLRSTVKEGDRLNVVAALELNKEHIHWQGIELYPVRIQKMP